jgi:hypothetical protein
LLCDGVDNDCDALTPDISDGDGDEFACDVDCDDGDPAVNPDAEEVCDGVDNDCDLVVDNAPAPVQLVQLAAGVSTGPTFVWPSVADATGYDVLRGLLSDLHADEGDFSQATQICLADGTPGPSVDDPDSPPAADGFWYIIRPTSCGGVGSYDSDGVGQNGLRDAEANASPQACP